MGQKPLITIWYILPWWPSWLWDQTAFSNPEADVVWRVSSLPPWLPSWILELNDLAFLNLHVTPMPPIKFKPNLTYHLREDVVWRISRWPPWWPSWKLEKQFWISITPQCLPSSLRSIGLTVWEQMWFEDFQDDCHGGHLGYQNNFRNSKSPCCPDASHQVSALSNLQFESR